MFHAFSETRACPQALTVLAAVSWTRLAYTQKGETQNLRADSRRAGGCLKPRYTKPPWPA